MVLSRPHVASLVMEMLADGRPRTAREIAAALRIRPGLESVERRDVNSILYSELSGSAVHDSEYRWHLPDAREAGDLGSAASDPPLTPAVAEHGSLLRTIQRLRSGLPPTEHLEELTVAPERAMIALQRFVSSDHGQRWLVVAGDYGHGKTHILYLIRDLAARSGLAACFLSADGYGSALNHPQRFLHTLLSTMEVPGRKVRGYEDLIHEVLLDAADAVRLRGVVNRYLLTGREVDLEVNYHLSKVISALEEGNVESEDRVRSAAIIAYYLSGQSIAHRSGPVAREVAYVLLRVALDLVRELGATGLVVVIDEAESIYTKLTVRARHGAFRVLAALCESPFLAHCSVAIAMTPDASRYLTAAASYMGEDPHALRVEPVSAFATSLTNGSLVTLKCEAPRPEVRRQLLDRVKTLYGRAYAEARSSPGFMERWKAYSASATPADVPVRVVVRQAVNFLDTERYRLY